MGNGTARALPWQGPAQRIGALVLRHTYLLRRSWPRLLELTYWPTVQMIIWGLVTTFLVTNSSWVAQAAGVLLAGVILWDVMFRGQIGLSLVFIEEMWSRNLGHLFVSPLRSWELIFALMLISLIRTLIGMTGAVGFAYLLYAFSIFDLGFALIGFFVNLIVMGWAVGFFVCGLVLRYGPRRREPRLVPDLRAGTLQLRLLPALDPAGLAGAGGQHPAVRPRLRGHARAPGGRRLQRRSHDARESAQHRLDCGRHSDVSRFPAQRPHPRPAASDRGIALNLRGR